MKPVMFKDANSLISFINRLPVPQREAKNGEETISGEEVISELSGLAPDIFKYKDLLVKGRGGLGNNKSLLRFCDAVQDNVLKVAMDNYDTSIEEMEEEVELLLGMGGSTELAENLRTAKTNVSRFKCIRETIDGFKDKLNNQMSVVHKNYNNALQVLEEKERELKKVLGSSEGLSIYNILTEEMSQKVEDADKLIQSMSRYCELQVVYNGMLLA